MTKTLIVALCLVFGLPVLAHAADGKPAATVPAAPAKARRCVFPDSPRESAPAWVCSKTAPGIAVAAVGWHKKSKAGVQFTKDQAVASARVALVQNMTQQLGRKLGAYATQQKLGGPAATRKLISPAFEQQTRRSLTGSRIVQQATSRKGTIYVLVGIDPQQASQATHEIVKGAAEQEPALWQPVKGKQSADELAAAVAALD